MTSSFIHICKLISVNFMSVWQQQPLFFQSTNFYCHANVLWFPFLIPSWCHLKDYSWFSPLSSFFFLYFRLVPSCPFPTCKLIMPNMCGILLCSFLGTHTSTHKEMGFEKDRRTHEGNEIVYFYGADESMNKWASFSLKLINILCSLMLSAWRCV